jgi:Tetracyclin repressor-like, C-terminal domain
LELFQPILFIRDIEAATFLLLTTVEAVTHDGAVYAPAMLRASLKQELTDMMTRYLLGPETALRPRATPRRQST